MTSGLMEDLIDVRRYLDLAREGWYGPSGYA
jgi:hypothetical protein